LRRPKGRSEWDRQAANLKRLADAYGTTFPVPEGAAVLRMNDKETAGIAAAIATAADHFKSDVDKVKTLPKPDVDAAKKDIDGRRDRTSASSASTRSNAVARWAGSSTAPNSVGAVELAMTLQSRSRPKMKATRAMASAGAGPDDRTDAKGWEVTGSELRRRVEE
jgi:hypothetical protein